MQIANTYCADGMHKTVCNLISSHVCVNVKRSCQLLSEMRVNYILQLNIHTISQSSIFLYHLVQLLPSMCIIMYNSFCKVKD